MAGRIPTEWDSTLFTACEDVKYDRATEAWWPQVPATSIPGPWDADPKTASLREFRAIWTTWKRWRNQHPDTRVLSTDTGAARNYGQDPYGSYNPPGGYYAENGTLFPMLNEDGRYHPKEVFMGARTPDGAVAFRKDALRDRKLVSGKLAGATVLAAYDPRYDTGYVYHNPDGSSFEFEDGFVIAPDDTEYAPGSLGLSRIHTFNAMWFAWVGFYPETTVYG